MSGIGNALVGALGGAGAGVAGIASRYVDEEIQQRRAQALAELQHQTMVRGEEYTQSAPVQERRLGNERNLLKMRNATALEGKVAEASDPGLRQAKIDERVGYLQGTTQAEVDAQNTITTGTAGARLQADKERMAALTPLEIARAAGVSDAQWRAREKYDQRLDAKGTKSAFERLPEAKKLEVQSVAAELKDISKAMIAAQAEGGWDPAKNPGQKQLAVTKAALEFRLRGLLSGGEEEDPLGIFGAKPATNQPSAAPGKAPEPAANLLDARRSQAGNATAPAEPGVVSKALSWFAESGRDYDNPEGKAELRRRMAEAQSGGQALTRVERLRATQLGLLKA